MNYVGMKVIHKARFGTGVIIEQSDSNHVTVKFDALPEPKTFVASACFTSFLQLLDSTAAHQAVAEAQAQAKKEEAAKAQKEQETRVKLFEQRAQSKPNRGNTDKQVTVTVPCYASLDAFFDEQERLIVAEIVHLRQSGGKKQKIVDGERVEFKNGIYLYTFESDSELNIPDNTQISLWQSGDEIPGTIINCEEFTLIIATTRNLGERVPVIEFSAEPWKLLHFLTERLKSLRAADSFIARTLILDGRKQVQFNTRIMTGQDNAIQLSLKQPISFVWGPPGTGKTETLAKIALQHMANGHRVLMLSYSNVSVDGAILRVFNKAKAKKPGVMVRYGYPKDKELLRHEYLTSYNLALANHPELVQERLKLIEERKHLSHTSSRFVAAGTRLTQIRKQLQAEERKAVTEASFVATTVSKAIADSTLYEDTYDTVIFDEASMAYIPQIVFSAGLAGKHFVCMGDFAQLPPIVQSSDSSALNADIFQFCGIADAVQAGYAHKWLCMLDTQYRMHPDIAAFSSKKMYRGLLKTAPGIREARQPIADRAPLGGKAVGLYDLSGMMSVCLKTADQSRINVLSAMISMGIAIKAAEKYDVGVISPYSAQSRLLHAMSRDIAEQWPQRHKIVCATVHQFQGSERDVIIYDAVDCYRMQYPGRLLTSNTNNYANRLYNVALTRARGKFLSVVNADYMRTKNLSQSLMFREMIEETDRHSSVSGNTMLADGNTTIMKMGTGDNMDKLFLSELAEARSEVRIDIPGTAMVSSVVLKELVSALNSLKGKGRKVTVRAESKAALPPELRSLAIENSYVANPVTMIDKRIVWYGMPHSGACFVSEGKTIPTRFRPIIRFEGKHFAQALYGFLEMNRTVDQAKPEAVRNADGRYDTFSAYVSGEVKCPVCKSPMQLKKGKSGKFFLGCTGYPKCDHTEFATEDMIDSYFYYHNPNGKHCPRDNTSLEPCLGRYGMYIRCNGLERHTFKLDEI